MTVRKIEVERLTLVSSKTFDAIAAAVENAIGRPDMREFGQASRRRRNPQMLSHLHNDFPTPRVHGRVCRLSPARRGKSDHDKQARKLRLCHANNHLKSFFDTSTLSLDVYIIRLEVPIYLFNQGGSCDERYDRAGVQEGFAICHDD
jgi:hypothetical protein